ncbi:hypothetical protein CUMW_248340, partial [Citrus unshiu]
SESSGEVVVWANSLPAFATHPVESTDLIVRSCNITRLESLVSLNSLDLIFNKPNGVIPSKFSGPCVNYVYLIGNLLSGAIPADWMFFIVPDHWSLHINCCGKQVIADGNTTFEDDSDAAGASKLAPLINPVISSIELKGLDLHTGSFHLRQIKAATNNFASENEISEGGFGPVYRGLLADGKVIEVKQLSSNSKQGNREIVNEIGMISALQHPNLVKLYGLCTETLKQPMCFLIRT